jgi:hypothetical protein
MIDLLKGQRYFGFLDIFRFSLICSWLSRLAKHIEKVVINQSQNERGVLATKSYFLNEKP